MPEHGKENTYTRHGCRCDDCVVARRGAERRRRRMAQEKATPDAAHGTLGGYVYWGCRCIDCLRAWKGYSVPYMQDYRARNAEKLARKSAEYRKVKRERIAAKELARKMKK